MNTTGNRKRGVMKVDYKKIKRTTVVISAVTAALYSLIAGKGPFNKTRFREQHEVLSKYVDNNYPDCAYSPITMHGRGWASSIRRYGKVVSFVYFSKDCEGNYIFTESRDRLR